MQSKNTITIVHTMADMCGMHKIYIHIIWNAGIKVENCLLPLCTRRQCDSSFENNASSKQYIPGT